MITQLSVHKATKLDSNKYFVAGILFIEKQNGKIIKNHFLGLPLSAFYAAFLESHEISYQLE